jgi:hypothetical protein
VVICPFVVTSAPSMLVDAFARLALDTWLVAILALTLFSERSTLEDEFERLKLEV